VTVQTLALCCKAFLAVLLLAAGGAKLADLPGFAATVRLFAPRALGSRLPAAIAAGIAIGELALGAASLTSPQAGWLNVAVFAAGCGFAIVSVVGYVRHPGTPCRCFGALSRRAFSPAGIGRSMAVAACAAVAAWPAGQALAVVGAAGRLGLLAGGTLVAGGAYSAAAALGAGRDPLAGRA